jgi:hypothetical membrane protein
MPYSYFRFFGTLGPSILLLAILFSGFIYRGRLNEKYSPWNHYISELGEVGTSKGARLFNISIILSGLFLLPPIIKLGTLFQSVTGWLGTVAGVAASLGVIGVGFFPVNNLKPHNRAALLFFRSGLCMILFFGMAILFQEPEHIFIPIWLDAIGFLGVVCYLWFLILLSRRMSKVEAENKLSPETSTQRPVFDLVPALEWAIFITTLAWLFALSTAL